LEVAKIFVEEGKSAKTITNRPELLALIDYCGDKKNRVQSVIVWKLDRLSREQFDFHWLKRELSKHEVGIHSTTETMKEEDGPLMGGIYAAIAEHDNWMRAQRTKAGMKARLRAGEWTHDVPLGYTRNGNGVEICPETGPLVRKIFEMYGTGMYSQAEMLRRITKLGLRTKRGNALTPQSLSHMVRNQFYAGWISSKALGPEKVEGNFEPLIDQELFDKVQAIRLGKQPRIVPRQKSNPDFPLRSFVRCGTCGRPLTGGWPLKGNRKYAYYWCYSKGCRGVSVRRDILEKDFCEHLDRLRPDPEHLRLFRHIVGEVMDDKRSGYQAERNASEQLIGKLEQRKQRLIDHLLAETIDDGTYKQQVEKIETDIAVARVRHEEVKLEEFDVDGVLGFAERVVMNASQMWLEADMEKRDILQRTLFPSNISYLDGRYLKSATCLLFKDLQTNTLELSNVG
jgi:DNA invertase Pin-like site-specific DNA recombinase